METLFVGQNTIYLPEVDSTNSYAIELLKNVNLSEGTLIYTQNQVSGKGQRGNTWVSEAGLNIAASYVFKPTFLNLNALYYLYIISALAVYDLMAHLLDSSQYDIKIKWPNDILVNNQKIAGILNENSIQNNKISASVIGIGININQTSFNSLTNVTSLKLLSNKSFDANALLIKLNSYLEAYYLKLKHNQLENLLQVYYKRFYKINQQHTFILKNKPVLFYIIGINNKGLLHLKDMDGNNNYFDVKEISWY